MNFNKLLLGLVGYLYVDKKFTEQRDAVRDVEETIRESTKRQLRAIRRSEIAKPEDTSRGMPSENRLTGKFNLNGPAVVMLMDEDGQNKLTSGRDLDDALDSLFHKPGRGASALDRMLDCGGVLLVADANFKLKYVICRERDMLRDVSNAFVAQIKLNFRIPDDLHLAIGWRNGQDGLIKGFWLNELLGRSLDSPRIVRTQTTSMPGRENAIEQGRDESVSTESLYRHALEILNASGIASSRMLQRRMRITGVETARIMSLLQERGVLGPEDGLGQCEILVDLNSL